MTLRPREAWLLIGCMAPAAVIGQQARVVEQQSGVTSLLQSVSAVDSLVAWIGGANGVVLRTVDGGAQWERVTIPGASRLEFRGIAARSAREAWAMSAGNGSQSNIFHTSDGGATWERQFVNTDSAAFYDCLAFLDGRHGVAYSDASHGHTTILRTADGGGHWTLLPESAVPPPLPGEGAFAASNGCVVVGDHLHAWIGTGAPGARVFRTADQGATWTLAAATTPFVHGAEAGITGLAFADSLHGIGVAARIGGDMRHDTSSAAVAVTDDGGATWTLRTRPPLPGVLSGVAIVPRANGARPLVLVAAYGGLFASDDRGLTWRTLTTQGYWAVRGAQGRAWAVGPGGRITRIH